MRSSLEPVLCIEFGVASEIEVSFALTDWKEKPDLRSDAGNARPESAEHGTRAAIAYHLIVDIADGADVQFLGEIGRNRTIQMCVDAAAVLRVWIDEVVGESDNRGPFKSNLLVQISVAETEVVFRPYNAVIPTAACPPNTGVANTYVGVSMTKSLGDFMPV